jgi:SAM-dependent methyltransferase
MPDQSLPAAYFQSLYENDPDPWRFASSDYEKEKYAATLAVIGETRIARAWEVGCSIGVFTAALADLCDAVLAVDVADAALAQARRRCAGKPGVRLERLQVPAEWPEGRFDLIVFSEVLYFLSASDIRLTARRSVASLERAGRIVLVNWTGENGQVLSGEAAADAFLAAAPELSAVSQDRRPGYRVDIIQHGD